MKYPLITLLATTLLFSCGDNKQSVKETHTEKKEQITEVNHEVQYKSIDINGVKIAYREVGNPENKTLVLLHGFPASSHQYRKILEQLGNEYHLVAPDYPGFGNSDFPNSKEYEYTFDNLAVTIDAFLEKKKLNSYALMVHDFGAPVGFRIATAHPERITAIITQNGNIYEEGIGAAWAGVKNLWKDRNEETEKALLSVFSVEGLKWQYTHGVKNIENINPDNWNLDYLRLSRPGAHAANFDLFYDYQNNLTLYPTWQKYIRDNQPPVLVVWGKNDAFFPIAGAEGFKKDAKNIDYNTYDTGHFPLEENGDEIIKKISLFMKKIN